MNPALVEIESKIPDAIFDIRYATENNITGTKLYDRPFALLVPSVLASLARAADDLRQAGYRLVVFDAWRPVEAQRKLRKVYSDDKYVAKVSNHCRGITVDLTLADQKGNYLDMGTDYDCFSEKAHRGSGLISVEQKKNRDILSKTMEKSGFSPHPYEWWHFDYLKAASEENIDPKSGSRVHSPIR